MDLPAAVRENPLFRDLSNDQVNALIAIATTKNFEGGDTLVRQFDRDTDLMVVLSGRVCIKTFSGETISELMPGGIFGEVSLVDSNPRSATVVAMGSGSVAVFPSHALHDHLESDLGLKSTVMKNVATILCARLRAANVHLDSASGKK